MSSRLKGVLSSSLNASVRPAARAWANAQASSGTLEKLILERLGWEREKARANQDDGFCNLRIAMLRSQLQQLRAANSLASCAILGSDLHAAVIADRDQARESQVSSWLMRNRVALYDIERILLPLYNEFPFPPREQ
jgi:hypothetical protein